MLFRTEAMIRALTIVDVFTRESLAIEAGQSLKGADVVRVLSRICLKRTTPKTLFCDNGSEFTSQAMDLWAYHASVQIDFWRPGKPTDNAYVESFNGTLRSECLDAHWFATLAEARQEIEASPQEYNESRPHGRWARGRRTKSPMSSRLAANSLANTVRPRVGQAARDITHLATREFQEAPSEVQREMGRYGDPTLAQLHLTWP
jgi:transposase InsO family protein